MLLIVIRTRQFYFFIFFFFNDTATTEIYTLSLHDALPISTGTGSMIGGTLTITVLQTAPSSGTGTDRKSTRLNSSHANISYAVFCLKKKKINKPRHPTRPTTIGSTTSQCSVHRRHRLSHYH